MTFDLDVWFWPYDTIKKVYGIRFLLLYCTLVSDMMSVYLIIYELWSLILIIFCVLWFSPVTFSVCQGHFYFTTLTNYNENINLPRCRWGIKTERLGFPVLLCKTQAYICYAYMDILDINHVYLQDQEAFKIRRHLNSLKTVQIAFNRRNIEHCSPLPFIKVFCQYMTFWRGKYA